MIYYPEVIQKNYLRRITHFGIQFNFYYTPEYSLNPIVADVFIPDVFNHVISKNKTMFPDNVFKGYVFHIWNNTRKDVPVFVQKDIFYVAVKQKIIHLNLSLVPLGNIVFNLREIVSKIIGYMYADYLGFKKNSYLKKQWISLRGHICKNKALYLDLFTEDFKVLFGQSRGFYSLKDFDSNNYYTDNFDIGQNIRGLKDLIYIWRFSLDYFRVNKYKHIIKNRQLIYLSDSKYYIGILFLQRKVTKFFQLYDILKIDKKGLHVFDKNTSNWLLKSPIL